MARGLYGKGAVYAVTTQLNRLVYNIFIAAAVAVVGIVKRIFKIFAQPVARYGIGNYGGAALFARHHICGKRYKAVAVDFLAVSPNAARAVNIGIENNTEIGVIIPDRRAYASHSVLVFGIGYVVREHSVRL